MKEADEMALWGKHLLGEPDDLSSIPRAHKELDVVTHSCNPGTPQVRWEAEPGESAESSRAS